MDLKLEVVVLPVSDVDRAKDFYKRMGFREDIDFADGAGYRVVQLTPPGSACSIIFGTGVTSAQPGSIDRMVLAVVDIAATRADLASRGIQVGEVFHDAGGGLGAGFHTGTVGRASGPDPQGRSYGSYASFSDPDGNGWMLQELTERLPGRV
ncbi:MAG TPA: VOC family protein [Candidatus Binatia bacterium]|jgi:catechol 2,3-dioxygenase-like lactoylglutathione lyase family enzyme|nr:VOC family protein [Candidatus Binatia bacterium]